MEMEEKPEDLLRDAKPLHHQVGGHAGKTSFLECGDGTILKPLQSRGRGDRELAFYRRVYEPACSDPVLLELRPLLPTFLGAFTSPDEPNVSYMQLGDVAAGLHCPCLLDIKMGARTYDPLADPAKIAREDAKYPPAKKIGFQLRGMRIYDGGSGSFQKHGKEYLRKYTEETVEDALRMFFTNGHGLRKDIVRICLRKVQPIMDWFEKQKDLSFYASSILIAYEGSERINLVENGEMDSSLQNLRPSDGPCPKTSSSNQTQRTQTQDSEMGLKAGEQEGDCDHGKHADWGNNPGVAKIPPGQEFRTIEENLPGEDLVRVCMIDFTHVFPLNGKVRDENYLLGVETLVRYLKGLSRT